jgi:putative ABC transport system permease protein
VLKLALRNLFRHRGRSALTLSVIAFGIAALVLIGGFVEDVFFQLREATIHSQLGHIQIFSKGYREHGGANPYEYLIDQPGDILQRVANSPGVDAAMARLSFTGMINNGHTDLAIVGEGIEPGKEAALGTYVTITAGRQLAATDTFGILLGQGVARATKLGPGDRATILLNTTGGALNTLDFDVIGVFRTFSKEYDAHAVRVTLSAAQELLGTRGVNAIVVLLNRTESTDAVAESLQTKVDSRRYEVKTWRTLADFYDKTDALYRRQFAVLEIIILIAVLLSVANSVNMSVFERIGEFGTLMALGNRQSLIFKLVVMENLILGIAGSVLGSLIGVLAAWVISAIGIQMPPPPNSDVGYTAMIRLSLNDVAAAFSIGVAATILAALLPARRVSHIPVVEALRQN